MKKVILFFIFLIVSNLAHSNGAGLLKQASWARAPYPTPFKKNFYPIVSFLPAGTIIFDIDPEVKTIKGVPHIKVTTQHGAIVYLQQKMIKNKKKVARVISFPNAGLKKPGRDNDKLILHDNILCLKDSNKISLKNVCIEGRSDFGKVGKSWVYSFLPQTDNNQWYDLTTTINLITQKRLDEMYGKKNYSIKFDSGINELEKYENQGYLTMLNKEMPSVVFEYVHNSLYKLDCGVEKISQKAIKGEIEAKLSTSDSSLVLKLLSSLGFNMDVKGGLSTSIGTTEKKTISTKNSSRLVYKVNKKEKNRTTSIIVEKHFDCTSGSEVKPGKDITKINFESFYPKDSSSEPICALENKGKSLKFKTPDFIKNSLQLPVFLSVNSEVQQRKAIANIIDYCQVDYPTAFFILSNINDSCRNDKKRTKCAQEFNKSNSSTR